MENCYLNQPLPWRLLEDRCFRFVIPYIRNILIDFAEAFLGHGWQSGSPQTQLEFVHGTKRVVVDGAVLVKKRIAMIECHRYQSREEIIDSMHRKLCLARLSSIIEEYIPLEILCLLFTDLPYVTQGKPFVNFGIKTNYGQQWPTLKLKVVDVTKMQRTKMQNDLCNDLLARRLQDMRTPNIINAMSKAFNLGGDPVESALDLFAKQEMEKGMTLGMEKGVEKGKALGKEELAATLVSSGLISLEDIAKALGKSKEDLGRVFQAMKAY